MPAADSSFPLPTLAARQRRMSGAVVVVQLCGEVDIATEGVMRQALTAAAGTADLRLLVCDMTGVSFLSCVGLTVLLRTKAALKPRGVLLRVIARSSAVVMLFDATGLADTLGLCANLQDATGGPT